jgi:hypothetical protein
MVAQYSDFTKLRDAKQIARDHGHFVVEKPDGYLLYREASPKNVYVGKRKDVADMLYFVKKVTGFR